MSHLNEVDSLIADLWRTKGETSWWSPNRSRRLAAIRSLAEQATWRQLPQLVMLLQYAETAESAVFQDACSAILQRTLPNELPALDQAMRSSYYGDQFVYHSIDKDMLLRLIGTGEARTPLLKLATMVANGYVREAALRRLVLSGDPEVVIFLLLRANDWVKPLQIFAVQQLRRFLAGDEYLPMFLGNLPLVMRLGDQRRSDHSELILEIAQRLCSEAARSCLLNELRRDDLGVRLRIVRLFRRCRLSMPEAMTQLFLASRHTGLVLEALDWIQGHQQGVRYEAQLRALLKRRSPIVRREALRVLMATLPAAEVRLELERALIDMSPALRAFARFYLRQQGVADFAARYWQWLTHARQVNDAQVHAAALLGLADVGRAEDAAAFLPDFQAGEARIRAAAVEAVGRLAFDEHAERLIEMLHDSQPQVVAAACRVARKSIGSAHITALAKAIDAEHRPYQLRMLLNLVDRLLLFHRLSLCLLAASKTDSAMVSTAEIALARCFWQMRFRLSTLLCSSSATEALADVWSRLDALAPVNPPLAQHIQQTLATLGVYRCK